MYVRAFRSLILISGRCLSNSEFKPRSFSGGMKWYPQRPSQIYNNNFINFQPCSTLVPPNKDEISQKILDEYLKDPQNEKQYKVLQLEIDIMRQNGENVPSEIKPRHWAELIRLDSRSKRKKYLYFVFGIEMKKQNLMDKKKKRLIEKPPFKNSSEQDDTEILEYRLGKNSVFLRFYESTMNHQLNWKLCRAMMFEQKIIIDCGFEDKMTRNEIKYCSRQLQLAFAANRAHDVPFDLHFCNLNPTEFLHQEFFSYIPTMYDPAFPINIHNNSYLDLFDKEKLIYLSPDSEAVIDKFDHDAIYIIGAIVDKVTGLPLSMAKAKRENIRTAKLPMDRYLSFGDGSHKSLTLNQMIEILADVRHTGDWNYSLRHVPRRKLSANREYQAEKRLKKIIFNNENNKYRGTIPQDYTASSRNKFRNNM